MRTFLYMYEHQMSRNRKKMPCAPSELTDQPAHSRGLVRVFAERLVGSQELTASWCGQQRLWWDCAEAQADLSRRWAHMSFYRFCRVCQKCPKKSWVLWLSVMKVLQETLLILLFLDGAFLHKDKATKAPTTAKSPKTPKTKTCKSMYAFNL